MNEWIGKTLNKVHIDSLLARGGMAEVYRGTHTTLQREVAVKILRNQYEDDPDLLERFQREARVVAKLRHQNIVQVFDYDAVDDHPYIVMEYVAGPSLSKYLSVLHKNKEKLELPEINQVLSGVAQALQYAHESGVVHRDIKPGNIILTSRSEPIHPGKPLPANFEPVLTDFGLVRFLNSSRQTSAGQTAGTPAYMSPEQARGETTDGLTDIYSLGIVLYEMLSGKVPFDGETTMSILLKHISEPPPPIPGLSSRLQRVLNKALAKNKAERFQKPIELARAFDSIVRSETEQTTIRGLTPVEELESSAVAEPADSLIVVQPPKKPARNWLPVGLVAMALLGSAIFLINGYALSATVATPTSLPTATFTRVVSLPPSNLLGPPVVVHFRDADAIVDQAVVEALALPAPPSGFQYEVWLSGPQGRLSLGILNLDAAGEGTLIFDAGQNENLISKYDQSEITLKPIAATSTETDPVAYTYTLPSSGLAFLRVLLVSFPDGPQQLSLLQSLSTDIQLLEQSSQDLDDAFARGDETSVKRHAEVILNMLVGNQGSDHKDWNSDGTASEPSTGYGFLLNGSNLGHIRAIYTYADYASNAPQASQNMILHGGEVKVCSENLAQWASILKAELLKVFTADSLTAMKEPVHNAVTMAKQISRGVDFDEDGKIETISGECGFDMLYSSAYAMADMPLLPVNFGTPTAVASGTPSLGPTLLSRTATSTSSGGGTGEIGVTAQPPAATEEAPHIPPGQQRTREPKPTNPNGGGGGGGGDGGGGGGGGNGGGNNGGGNGGGNSGNP